MSVHSLTLQPYRNLIKDKTLLLHSYSVTDQTITITLDLTLDLTLNLTLSQAEVLVRSASLPTAAKLWCLALRGRIMCIMGDYDGAAPIFEEVMAGFKVKARVGGDYHGAMPNFGEVVPCEGYAVAYMSTKSGCLTLTLTLT